MEIFFRNRVPSFWWLAPFQMFLFPFLAIWFLVKKWLVAAWLCCLLASAYCVGFFVFMYGWGLFEGGNLIIGIGSLLAALLLTMLAPVVFRLKQPST